MRWINERFKTGEFDMGKGAIENCLKRYNPLILTEGGTRLKMTTQPTKILETFPNPNSRRDYHIHMEIPNSLSLPENRPT